MDEPLLPRFLARLDDRERTAVEAARQWCEGAAAQLYVVGGTVRDLVLKRPHLDVDLAVDGDVKALVTEIATAVQGEAVIHDHFETGVVLVGDWSLDIARTRAERYRYPGALPEVQPAPIDEDLRRRDFTIHALALGLAGDRAGELLDPSGGVADLQARVVRILHSQSFVDDPTRVLRLARYAVRLDFEVEAETRRLAVGAARFLTAVTPSRVTHELERTFEEPNPEAALSLLDELHALRAIYPEWRLPANLGAAIQRLRNDGGPPAGLAEHLCTVSASWTRAHIQGLRDALELRQDALAALHDLSAATRDMRLFDDRPPDPWAIVCTFAKYSLAAVRGAAAAGAGRGAQQARRYVADWRHVRPALRGDDVIALGVPSGPAVGEVLRSLTAARLRGQAHTIADERRQVAAWLASRDTSHGTP